MWLDILFLIVAGYAFYNGYTAGIIRTVFFAASILIGLLVSMRYAGKVTAILQDIFNSDNALVFLLGFLLTFLLVIGLIRWLATGLEKLLGTVKLNFVNKGVGGLLYATLGTIILSTLLGLLDKATVISEESKNHSITWPLLATVPDQAKIAYQHIQPIFKGFWSDTKEVLEKNHEEGQK